MAAQLTIRAAQMNAVSCAGHASTSAWAWEALAGWSTVRKNVRNCLLAAWKDVSTPNVMEEMPEGQFRMTPDICGTPLLAPSASCPTDGDHLTSSITPIIRSNMSPRCVTQSREGYGVKHLFPDRPRQPVRNSACGSAPSSTRSIGSRLRRRRPQPAELSVWKICPSSNVYGGHLVKAGQATFVQPDAELSDGAAVEAWINIKNLIRIV